jgi:hypothetical protein
MTNEELLKFIEDCENIKKSKVMIEFIKQFEINNDKLIKYLLDLENLHPSHIQNICHFLQEFDTMFSQSILNIIGNE